MVEFLAAAAPLLFLLLAGHALCDYPLQGDFLARAKDHTTPMGRDLWPHALFAHAVIHGGMVAVLTGSAMLGVAETLVHAATDRAKCAGRISYGTDQAIHILCKLAWAIIAARVTP